MTPSPSLDGVAGRRPATGSLPAETRLLLAAIGHAFGAPPPESAHAIQWDILLRAVAHHRVAPVVAPVLAPMAPYASRAVLEAQARSDGLRAMGNAARAAALARAFAAAGIDMLVIKGPALSMQLHGDAVRRPYRDLDLLVGPADRDAALRILAAGGYGTEAGHVLHHDNAIHLRHRAGGLPVELHTRLTTVDGMFPVATADPFGTAAQIEVAGVPMRTLGRATALAYAAHHGARHRWSTLLWLADIAAATRWPADVWLDALAVAERTGTRRQFALATRLCADLFGLTAPVRVPLAAVERPLLRAAADIAGRMIAAPPGSEQDNVRRVGAIRVHGCDLLMQNSPGMALAHLRLWMRPSAHDRAALGLPPALAFLYGPWRAGRALLRAVGDRIGARRGRG